MGKDVGTQTTATNTPSGNDDQSDNGNQSIPSSSPQEEDCPPPPDVDTVKLVQQLTGPVEKSKCKIWYQAWSECRNIFPTLQPGPLFYGPA